MIRSVRFPPTQPTFGSSEEELDWRLRQVPETAACRGFYINGLAKIAENLGPGVLTAYRERFPVTRVSSMRMHPLTDYLRRVHCIVIAQYGPDGLQKGREFIQSYAIEAFSNSVLGRYLVQGVGAGSVEKFLRLLHWMNENRHLVVNYGSWHFDRTGESLLRATFVDEYLYIESSMVGALGALVTACGFSAELDINLESPFRGTIDLQLAHVPRA